MVSAARLTLGNAMPPKATPAIPPRLWPRNFLLPLRITSPPCVVDDEDCSSDIKSMECHKRNSKTRLRLADFGQHGFTLNLPTPPLPEAYNQVFPLISGFQNDMPDNMRLDK